MPSQTFSHTELVDADAALVWTALQTAETWGAIGGVDEIVDAVHDETGHLQGYRFETLIGGRRHSGTARTVEALPAERMDVEIDSADLTGSIRLDLAPSGEQTAIQVTMEVRAKSLLSSMFFPVIASAVGAGLPRNVAAFAKRLT